MSLALPVLTLILVTGGGIAGILFVRRHAPDGGFFNDSDRAAGVFGVLATGFAFVLGFIVFLAFTSYDNSRVGAEQEALQVLQLFETAQLVPESKGQELSGELICYGRFVVEEEWPAMQRGELGDLANPWGLEMFRTIDGVNPNGFVQESAYDKWRDETSAREEARRDRIHGADGIVPATLWILLILGAAVLLLYMMFFADSGERAVVQALQVGTVVVMLGATLILILQLNQPFSDGIGGLNPIAMQRTLNIIEVELADQVDVGPLPCDENGVPLSE
jgi:hypothetical protein